MTLSGENEAENCALVTVDESGGYFDRESKMGERLVEEYRQIHIAMGALHLGIETGEKTLGCDDYDWYEIELERLYMHLESLGAEGLVDQIPIDNEAVLAARKKTSKGRPARPDQH